MVFWYIYHGQVIVNFGLSFADKSIRSPADNLEPTGRNT
jgi:hypothetical protein